jgi:hypothetical protein
MDKLYIQVFTSTLSPNDLCLCHYKEGQKNDSDCH